MATEVKVGDVRSLVNPDYVADVPVLPPANCNDEAVWQMARRLYINHAPGPLGCERCGGSFPCRGRRLARAGLATAIGKPNPEASYWTAYARVLAFQERSIS